MARSFYSLQLGPSIQSIILILYGKAPVRHMQTKRKQYELAEIIIQQQHHIRLHVTLCAKIKTM